MVMFLGVLCTSGIAWTDASMARDVKGAVPDLQSFRVTCSDIMQTERWMNGQREYLAMHVELVHLIQ